MHARGGDVVVHDLEAIRESMTDAEVQGYADLLRREVQPRLRALGWRCAHDGADGVGQWTKSSLALIHSVAREEDGGVWSHVSCSRRDRTMPTWEQVRDVGWLVHPDLFGVVVVAPRSSHVSIAEVAHVWYRLDAASVPDFSGGFGTI